MKQLDLSLGFLLVVSVFNANSLTGQETRFPEFLIEQLDQIDLASLSPENQLQTYLAISAQLHTIERQELAHVLFADAIEVARQSSNPNHYAIIARHAIDTNQFEVAEKLVAKSGLNRKWLPHRIVGARIRAGNLAFDEKQFQVTDFHTSLDVSAALIENEKYEAVCDFVSDLVFEENDGNDPKDAEGIVYRNIAKKFFEQGDKATRNKLDTTSIKRSRLAEISTTPVMHCTLIVA